MLVLVDYENAPGLAGDTPALWPENAEIRRSEERATLVMLTHPHCSCSRASVDQLALIMARFQKQVEAYVLFYSPSGRELDWSKSELWQQASMIPGVKTISDIDGRTVKHFNAHTSGHTVLYDIDGKLVFSGGITPSRAHSGDNAGRSAITAFLSKHLPQRAKTFVFGCDIFNPEESRRNYR